MRKMAFALCVLLSFACTKLSNNTESITGVWISTHEEWSVLLNGKVTQKSMDFNPFSSIEETVDSPTQLTIKKAGNNTYSFSYQDKAFSVALGTKPARFIQNSIVEKGDYLKATEGELYWRVISIDGNTLKAEMDTGQVEKTLYAGDQQVNYAVSGRCTYTFTKQ